MADQTTGVTIGPPRWAEGVLRLILAPEDAETVSGDLLEEYRQTVYPAYGQQAANRWYVRQVADFLWRANAVWALLFGLAFVARTAFDWMMPTTDFVVRSMVSTYLAVGIVLTAAILASWRSRAVQAGTLAGVVVTVCAALVSVPGVALLLAFQHDEQTLLAAAGSGGLSEAFSLPLMLILPGAIVGTLGGVIGRAARMGHRPTC